MTTSQNEILIDNFTKLINNYSNNNKFVIGHEIKFIYKNKNRENDLKHIKGHIYFYSFAACIIFTPYGFTSQSFNIIELKFLFEKNNPDAIEYTIYDLLNFLDMNNFSCYTISSILTSEELTSAVKWLTDALDFYTKDLTEFAGDSIKKSLLQKQLFDHICIVSSIPGNYVENSKTFIDKIEDSKDSKETKDSDDNKDVKDNKGTHATIDTKINYYKNASVNYDAQLETEEKVKAMIPLYNDLQRERFTLPGYLLFLKKDYSKAATKYRKTRLKNLYETRLVKMLEKKATSTKANMAASEEPIILPDDLVSVILKANSLKNDKNVFGVMFVSWILMAPLFFIPYAGLFFLLKYIASPGVIYVAGQDVYNMILPAFLSSIIVSYNIRRFLYGFISKKKKDTIIKIDNAIDNKTNKKIMSVFAKIVFCVSLLFCLFITFWSVSFTKDGIIDNSGFFSLRGEYHSYKELSKIYKLQSRVNDIGDMLDFPSYVLVFNGGKKLDLYQFSEPEDIEKNVLPYLARIGFIPEIAATEEDIK